MNRIVVIFDNLGPYHIARLAATAQHCELLAIEVASVSKEYAWQSTANVPFERKTLFRVDQGEEKSPQELEKRLERVVSAYGPEVVVIPGWSGSHAMAALRLSVKWGIPVVLMSESQATDFPRTFFKEWVKRLYVGLCQAALVGGTPHQSYMESLGMQSERIRHGYDVVENAYFETRADEARMNTDSLRRQHGLPGYYFLASARFIPKKNLQKLIHAYGEYRRNVTGDCWHLVVLGDGELRPELEVLIDELGLRDFVHLPGFKQYLELPVFYGLAGGYIHASTTEQWGLVVNEAMASGLPVLVSERCGCATDLVENGRNGFTFDPYNVDALANLMQKISSNDCNRAAMGRASREIISHWTPETFAQGLMQAVDAALAAPLPRAGWIDKALLWALSYR